MPELGTQLVGLTANDSIEIGAGHSGGFGPEINVPAGETWTLVAMSEQFYSPYEGKDPQQAMFHLTVRKDNQDVNIYTQMVRTQERPCADGLRYEEYRNVCPGFVLTGPISFRVIGFNAHDTSVIFFIGMLWSRRASHG